MFKVGRQLPWLDKKPIAFQVFAQSTADWQLEAIVDGLLRRELVLDQVFG